VDRFVTGVIPFGSFTQFYLPWWRLAKDGCHGDKLLFLTYEDIVSDMKAAVTQIASFVQEELSEVQLDIIVHNCQFYVMAREGEKNAAGDFASKFFRKGKIGDWHNHFTAQQLNKFEDLDQQIKDEGLHLLYE